uniref:hypothetical protein n=1 Tax=Paenibacillus xylanexedens TaxID=528191 RepID=UPI001C930E40
HVCRLLCCEMIGWGMMILKKRGWVVGLRLLGGMRVEACEGYGKSRMRDIEEEIEEVEKKGGSGKEEEKKGGSKKKEGED